VRWGLLGTVVVVWLVAFVARWVLVRALPPRPAAFVERWWGWLPLLVVVVGAAFVHPLLALAAAVVAGFALTSAGALGSPFRPRR
jgi:hypothetical protein